jgi:hypothetical protein
MASIRWMISVTDKITDRESLCKYVAAKTYPPFSNCPHYSDLIGNYSIMNEQSLKKKITVDKQTNHMYYLDSGKKSYQK